MNKNSLTIKILFLIALGSLNNFSYCQDIELPRVAQNIAIGENVGGKVIDGKEYLDLQQVQDPISLESFKNILEEKQRHGLGLIIAVAKTKANGVYNHSYYEALGLNEFLFGLDYARNRYVNGIIYKNPSSNQPIVSEIEYFFIEHSNQEKAHYVGTDYDLLCDNNLKIRLLLFFKAQNNDATAQANLGVIYEKAGNLEEAKRYWTLAANQGNSIAQNNLGIIYEKAGNLEEAKKYYNLAVNQGNSIAQNNLGVIYEKAGNLEEAKKYYDLAANQGNSFAQNRLGVIHELGGNKEEAIKCYIAALYGEEGNINYTVALKLGVIFLKDRNLDEAEKYFSLMRSCPKEKIQNYKQIFISRRDVFSQVTAAILYDELEDNKEEALKYYTLAAAQGDNYAQRRLQELTNTQSFEEKKRKQPEEAEEQAIEQDQHTEIEKQEEKRLKFN